MSIGEFATERLHLRPLGPSDEPIYCRLYTDPELMRHIGPPLSGPAASRAFQVACRQVTGANPTSLVWTIDQQRVPIGIAACVRSPAAPDEAELGLMLVEEAHGVGLAAEALTALTDRVFACLQLQRVWTRHAPENLASARLMEKMRFNPGSMTAAEVQWQMRPGQWHDLRPVGCGGRPRMSATVGGGSAQVTGLADAAGGRKLAAGAMAGCE